MNVADIKAIAESAIPALRSLSNVRRSLNIMFLSAWRSKQMDFVWRELKADFPDQHLHYFVRARGTGDLKIGRTNWIGQRFYSLDTGCSRGADLVACYPAEMGHEGELKQEFKPYNLRGEWFIAHSDLFDYLKSIGSDTGSFTNEVKVRRQMPQSWRHRPI